jgi:hypothetical protein
MQLTDWDVAIIDIIHNRLPIESHSLVSRYSNSFDVYTKSSTIFVRDSIYQLFKFVN